MNLKQMSKEELENMSYDDLAFALLSEKNKKMKIIDLFTEIGKLIDLTPAQIEEQVADFFEILTLDKRFIMLDGGYWDLKSRHVQKLVIDEDEEDINIDDVLEEDTEEEDENEIFYDDETDDDEADDDLKDLVIIDEDEEESML
jgi:DNA-directed RNA polymerase subunit delta